MIDEKFMNDALSADINPRVIEPISPNGENGQCAEKLLFAEREVWEATRKEALGLAVLLKSILATINKKMGQDMATLLTKDYKFGMDRLHELCDLLAVKDEVQK